LSGTTVASVKYCALGSATDTDFNVVTVETTGPTPDISQRLGSITSSCGLCGHDSIEALIARLSPLPPSAPWPTDLLLGAPELVTGQQKLFKLTGTSHLAAAIDRSGTVLAVREDIGRHNAVDKVIGRLVLDQALDADDRLLFVSSRASFEIVQKAWTAGFSAVVSVSGPSALAVSTARAAGMTLAGFVRPGGANLYSPA
jgi:FdhD protein